MCIYILFVGELVPMSKNPLGSNPPIPILTLQTQKCSSKGI